MNSRFRPTVVALGTLTIWAAIGAKPPRADETAIDASCFSGAIKPGAACPGEETDPQAAVNSPTRYSWETFARINQPAFPGNPDDSRRVWETWKSADDNTNRDDAIYLNNGHAPQPWDVKPRKEPLPKRLAPIQQLQMLAERTPGGHALTQFIGSNPLVQEVRVNRPAFNFIVDNKLYNLQGQYQFASTHPNFDFPTASKEVKAVWVEANDKIVVADYYAAKAEGKTYVLVAMHVITKDVPFWLWSSFVHKDQNKDPANGYVAPLAGESPPGTLRGTPFENYRLLAQLVQSSGATLSPTGQGSQIDWITRTGLPTVIGNPQIESTFETKSSCITCHAQASIGMTAEHQIKFNNFLIEVGAVNPARFSNDGVTYYPVDFLWSLRHAKPYSP